MHKDDVHVVKNCAHESHKKNNEHELHVKESIIHAVEIAEKAVVHALRDEVDVLFNDHDHQSVRTVSMSGNNKKNLKEIHTSNRNDRNQFGWGLDQSIGF